MPAPEIEYWYAADNTIEDVKDGALVYRNSGTSEVLRDDSARLRSIAGLLYAIRAQQPATLSIHLHQVSANGEPGTLVVDVDGIPVGTVIQERTWHFGEEQSLEFSTALTELEAVEWASAR